MSTTDYFFGQTVRVSVRVRVGRVLTDPGAITLQVRDPSGTQTNYTFAGVQVVKDSTGIYHYDLLVNAAGEWTLRWITTAPAPGTSSDFSFEVDPTVMV